ncbi:MAG: hypothetical protein Q7T83_04350 [Thermodesulfovibrionales bacterium]|nr:hypothetical protein [Thermodesulfovibrionales bacterium]MDP3111286.1 hypothetical protein [Thermodesulfovibrionales bacterium]
MQTVTISKKEYEELVEKKLRYEHLHQIIEEDIFSPPPTKNIKEITKAFQKTGLYNQRFIDSLEKGLKRSAYFK